MNGYHVLIKKSSHKTIYYRKLNVNWIPTTPMLLSFWKSMGEQEIREANKETERKVRYLADDSRRKMSSQYLGSIMILGTAGGSGGAENDRTLYFYVRDSTKNEKSNIESTEVTSL